MENSTVSREPKNNLPRNERKKDNYNPSHGQETIISVAEAIMRKRERESGKVHWSSLTALSLAFNRLMNK